MSRRYAGPGTLGGLLILSLSCGGRDSKRETLYSDDAQRQPCPVRLSRIERIDLNGDRRPDVQQSWKDGRLFCAAMDLNFDGKVDVKRFYESNGKTIRREEHDFDFDGELDQVSFFKAGSLVRKDLDTNYDKRIDTRIWCQNNLITRALRDRWNTGHVNTWEDYAGGRLVRARYDTNNDGVADRWELFSARGELRELRYDSDGDGKIDSVEPIPAGEGGSPSQPVRCDGTPLDSAEESAPADASKAKSGESGGAPLQEGERMDSDESAGAETPREPPKSTEKAATDAGVGRPSGAMDAGVRGAADAGVSAPKTGKGRK